MTDHIDAAAKAYAAKPLEYITVIGCDVSESECRAMTVKITEVEAAEAFRAGALWAAAQFRHAIADGKPDDFIEFLERTK